MDPKLEALLCQEDGWKWGGDGYGPLFFRPDGTGRLWIHIEVLSILHLGFRWKILDAPEVQHLQTRRVKGSLLLVELRVEITLYQEPLDPPGPSDHDNFVYILESALRPKTCTLRLSEGHYTARSYNAAADSHMRYRLALEPSPYPSLDEWTPFGLSYARRYRFPEWRFFHYGEMETRYYIDEDAVIPRFEEEDLPGGGFLGSGVN